MENSDRFSHSSRHDGRHGLSDKLPTQFYTTLDSFELESGEVLVDATVAFTIRGQLNEARTNVIVICHALSGNADCFDWWSLLLSRPSKPAIDTSKYCVICFNALGSPYGSSSPLSSKPGSASLYGYEFPQTTIRDDARIQKRVLDILGVQSVYCVVGGSMGGMLALEWSLLGQGYVQSLVVVATTARQSPWAIAWAENQRATIKADAKYRGGDYGDDPPVAGLRAARMAAMLSYRTHASFETRFGRRRVEQQSMTKGNNDANGNAAADARCDRDKHGTFSAQSYLRYQGDKFNARFDANCYLHLLDKIDSHDITRGRFPGLSDDEAMREVLGQIRQPSLVVGIPTDGLYPLREQMALCRDMPNATFAVLESEDGHDGFLIEGEQLNYLLHTFFAAMPLCHDVIVGEEEEEEQEEERSIWEQVVELKTRSIFTEKDIVTTG
ncbi:acetyl coenzyme A:deacetylcephalosporin C o-acetyltransferase [Xylariaceae sp. FL0594]|nr:acetyl coenzyme A:deacetylcephalosporin C o-acetyltransferase [Xylariaceae sp. FL0594]